MFLLHSMQYKADTASVKKSLVLFQLGQISHSEGNLKVAPNDTLKQKLSLGNR